MMPINNEVTPRDKKRTLSVSVVLSFSDFGVIILSRNATNHHMLKLFPSYLMCFLEDDSDLFNYYPVLEQHGYTGSLKYCITLHHINSLVVKPAR